MGRKAYFASASILLAFAIGQYIIDILFGYLGYGGFGLFSFLFQFLSVPIVILCIIGVICDRFRLYCLIAIILSTIGFLIADLSSIESKMFDIGFRSRVFAKSDIVQIQNWANELLLRPDSEITEKLLLQPGTIQAEGSLGSLTGRSVFILLVAKDRLLRGYIDAEALPACLRYLGFRNMTVVGSSTIPSKRHLELKWGGGFFHYGVLVGCEEFVPNPSIGVFVSRWRSGVYGFQE